MKSRLFTLTNARKEGLTHKARDIKTKNHVGVILLLLGSEESQDNRVAANAGEGGAVRWVNSHLFGVLLCDVDTHSAAERAAQYE